MALKDIDGREYASLSTLKRGDMVQVDAGFTCLDANVVREVREDAHGAKFITCAEGQHYLNGQLSYCTNDPDDDSLIGVYPVEAA